MLVATRAVPVPEGEGLIRRIVKAPNTIPHDSRREGLEAVYNLNPPPLRSGGGTGRGCEKPRSDRIQNTMWRTVKPGATHLQNQGVLALQTFARAVVQCQHSFPGVPVRILSNILMFQEYSCDSPLVFPFVTHCHSGGMYSDTHKVLYTARRLTV